MFKKRGRAFKKGMRVASGKLVCQERTRNFLERHVHRTFLDSQIQNHKPKPLALINTAITVTSHRHRVIVPQRTLLLIEGKHHILRKHPWKAAESEKKREKEALPGRFCPELSYKMYKTHKKHDKTLSLSHEFHEIEKNMETKKKILDKYCIL